MKTKRQVIGDALMTSHIEHVLSGRSESLDSRAIRSLHARAVAATEERDEALDREAGTADALQDAANGVLEITKRAVAAEARLKDAVDALRAAEEALALAEILAYEHKPEWVGTIQEAEFLRARAVLVGGDAADD